jgi:hypothetical protein
MSFVIQKSVPRVLMQAKDGMFLNQVITEDEIRCFLYDSPTEVTIAHLETAIIAKT